MHARQLAVAAGASGELVGRVVQAMVKEGNIRLERAKALVLELATSPVYNPAAGAD